MLQYAKFVAAAAALALAPAAFAQGHGHGGGGPGPMAGAAHSMAAGHSMGAAHSMGVPGENRHDVERVVERQDTGHRNAHSYGDYRHRGWTQGHHYGWTKHGRHHQPGALTHTYLSRHDRYRHRHHHVDRRHDHDNR